MEEIMGLLDGLFGRSPDRSASAEARCQECGMTGEAHTDWCPATTTPTATPTQTADTTPAVPEDETTPPPG